MVYFLDDITKYYQTETSLPAGDAQTATPKIPNSVLADNIENSQVAETATQKTAGVDNPFAKGKPTTAPLTEAGNVPLTAPADKDKMTGLTVEKSSVTPTKQGPSLNKALTNFYGNKYVNASEEEKEALIVKYFDWLSKDKKDVISQLGQFKLYRERCTDDLEYKRLSSVIDKMEAQYQKTAAKTVITEGTERQKDIGQRAVADDYHHYDKSVQTDVAQFIADSQNVEAIKIGASHASELASENQTAAVKIYVGADIDEKFKASVDKILIDQYGNDPKSPNKHSKFAVENQLAIHEIMSKIEISGVAEYAASNIWKLDKVNQAEAVKITLATDNKDAIEAATAQYGNYDESAKDEIADTFSMYGYDVSSQDKAQEISTAENKSDENSSVSVSDKFKEALLTYSSKPSPDNDDLKELVSKANNPVEREQLFRVLSPVQKAQAAMKMLDSDLSLDDMKVIYKLLKEGGFDDKTKKEIFLKLAGSDLFKTHCYELIGNDPVGVEIALNSGIDLDPAQLQAGSARDKYKQIINERNKGKYTK